MKGKFSLLTMTLLLFVAGCGLKTTTVSEFYKEDLQDVTKIVIVDGSTGYEKTVTDSKVIDIFINEIKEVKFIPQENQEKREGWRYSINLFDKEGESFQFGTSEVNGHYYDTEPDILHIVEEFYENLNVSEE